MTALGLGLGVGFSAPDLEDFTGVDFLVRSSSGATPVVGTGPTFTRATVAYGESGTTVVTVPTGTVRKHGGTRNGIIIEGANSGNILLYPRDYANAYWTKSARVNTATLTNTHLLPDGTTDDGVELTENLVDGTRYIMVNAGAGITNNAIHFTSVFCKRGDTSLATRNPCFAFHSGTMWAGDYYVVALNPDTGVVTEFIVGTPTLGNPVLESGAIEVNNGWWYLWAYATTGTSTAGQNFMHLLMLTDEGSTTPSYTGGNDTSSCLFWGSQLIETDSFSTSPVATQTDSSIAQNADVLSYPAANYVQAYGTLVLDFYVDSVVGTASTRMIVSIEGVSNHIKAWLDTSGDLVFEIVTATVTRTLTTAQALTSGRHILAVAFGNEAGATSDIAYLDGSVTAVPLTTDVNTTAAPTPANISNIYIGQDSTGNYLHGSVKEVKLYNTRKSVSFLREATGGSAWIPTDAAANELWFAADTLSYAEDDNVTTWDDLSGNSRDLTVPGAATAPKFRATGGPNSKPIVEFLELGNTTMQTTGTWTLIPQPLHIFLVYKTDNWSNVRYILQLHDVESSVLFMVGVEPEVKMKNTTTGPAVNVPVGSFHLVEFLNSGVSSTAIVDQGTPVTGTVGTAGMNSLTVGSIYALTNESEIDVAEIIIYSAEVTGSDLTSLRSYIADKYSL